MRRGKLAALTLVATVGSVLTLAGCGTGNQVATVQHGAVSLNLVRIGTPENVFKEGNMTFVQDPNGSIGGKNQYLSRIQDDNGGQYVVQAKNDECFEVDVIHSGKPLDKEVAVKTMENLLPPEVVASGKPQIDDSQLKAAQPMETYTWGGKYRGQLIFSDKSAKDVKVISASRVSTL